jgi:cytochrome d ubiquinol oxidase subunit II
LLNPFALLCGVVSLSMLVMHGAVWLQLRCEEHIAERARAAAQAGALIVIITFALAGVAIANWVDAYTIVSMPVGGAPSNPLAKEVLHGDVNWLANYGTYPWMLAAPVAGFAGALLTALLARARRPGWAFLSSSLAMAGIILTAGFSMFPFVMPSITQPGSSLTLWDASSSHLTLSVMFWAVVVFLPMILLYTAWTYRAMWGRVSVEQIRENTHSAY